VTAELSALPAASADRSSWDGELLPPWSWSSAPSASSAGAAYLLHQRFRYDYANPVSHLRHRLVVVPRATHGDQRRVAQRLTVTGAPALVSVGSDGFANHVVDVRVATIDEFIEFETWSEVRGTNPGGVSALAPSALRDRRLLAPTDLTRADEVLAEVAASLVAGRRGGGGPGDLQLAEQACAWTRGALTYAYDVTTVRTTAAEAARGGRGVCQDFAHVMLAVCRAAGLPARYVSGHLVGEGGSHAWVEVIVADPARPGMAEAVAFDPTHGRRAGEGYLTVAVGRDYADVAPTSGSFERGGPGVLSSAKRLSLVAADAPVSG